MTTAHDAGGQPIAEEGAPSHVGSSTTLAVRTRGFTRRFGKQTAVDAVDLAVPRGAVYGFLGPNGSGKTTTIRMLLGLLSADSGEIDVLGQRMPQASARVLPYVGALIEGPAFHPYVSGEQNLRRLDVSDASADPATSSAPHRAALVARRAHGRRRQEVPQLLARHEAAARSRRRVAAAAPVADPRRADQRPRSAGHSRGAQAGTRAGRGRYNRARVEPSAQRDRTGRDARGDDGRRPARHAGDLRGGARRRSTDRQRDHTRHRRSRGCA